MFCIPRPYLIFVTKFTCETCGEKYVMWRFLYMANVTNFRFLHMKDVENCKILTIVEKFLISPHDRCKKNRNLPCFVAKSVG